VVFDASEDGG
jgi:hypothetical protein